MTSRKRETEVESEKTADPELQLLYDHVRLTFIANARKIAESQKPETLLKMIQSCKEIQPVDGSQQELWKIVQKVRRELLARKSAAPEKTASTPRRRARNRKDHE